MRLNIIGREIAAIIRVELGGQRLISRLREANLENEGKQALFKK